jgi:hypothetical protein
MNSNSKFRSCTAWKYASGSVTGAASRLAVGNPVLFRKLIILAKAGIIGVYRSCRVLYLSVQSQINIYNSHQHGHQLPDLRIPKTCPYLD